MGRRLLTLLLLGLLAGVAAFPGVALAGDPCFHDLSRPPATTGATTAVAIGECTFGPTVTRVDVGDLVTWTNTSAQPHEIVGANLAWGVHDRLVQPGGTATWTFETVGVYPYTCMIHPGMTGAIVVGDPLAAGQASTERAEAAPAAAAPEPVSPTVLVVVGIGVLLLTGATLGTLTVARRRGRVAG
ncbi:MAG TPA: plastocyanin/azurin family copper-binding protein [Candidatus Limnocylindrales bacterium]|nr:plastocyanin/azurin family copper-binding protein [Candidatus Limnocylindrales bacterium]